MRGRTLIDRRRDQEDRASLPTFALIFVPFLAVQVHPHISVLAKSAEDVGSDIGCLLARLR